MHDTLLQNLCRKHTSMLSIFSRTVGFETGIIMWRFQTGNQKSWFFFLALLMMWWWPFQLHVVLKSRNNVFNVSSCLSHSHQWCKASKVFLSDASSLIPRTRLISFLQNKLSKQILWFMSLSCISESVSLSLVFLDSFVQVSCSTEFSREDIFGSSFLGHIWKQGFHL